MATPNSVWQYTRPGRLSRTIAQADRPVPEVRDGDVVIKVMAAALNPVDEQLCVTAPHS